MKRCTKCGVEKPRSDFFKSRVLKSGLRSWCKDCTRKQRREYRIANAEKISERERERYAANADANREYKRAWCASNAERCRENSRKYKDANREKCREYNLKYKEANKAKCAAQRAAQHAIAMGRLIRQPCEVCGETLVDAHHDDYSRPLDVRWLCRSHHKRLHAELEREQDEALS